MRFTVFSKFSKQLFVLHILFFFEIWTPRILTMLAMVNVVQIIISNIAHGLYEIYSVFKVFEIAVCFAHFGLFEISTAIMSNMLAMANIV